MLVIQETLFIILKLLLLNTKKGEISKYEADTIQEAWLFLRKHSKVKG